ncbi:MAG: DUF3990 domain-containing protein [Candidatus Azobacteroides sp.]|nr:DUF3990 domain-containing protein [Candidatus Azobacteroides sp.]
MKVYHGSYTKIDKIDLSKCEPRKDFGQGFYVTKFYEQALIDDWLDFVALNRNFNTPLPTHDFDIVEGPVADDKITTRIDAYIRGEVSKEDFLQELKYNAPSHQICFCTVKSLLMLEQIDFRGITAIERMSESIVEKLLVDNNISALEAADLFYNSDTYVKLSEIKSNFYFKTWQEIYELLRNELNSK